MKKNELEGWYLVRAYVDADPFATVMDLPREEALDVYKKIAPAVLENLAKGHDNLKSRQKFENGLREKARVSGVDIRKENPVYFVLTRDPQAAGATLQPMANVADKKVIVIPASVVNLSTCSFTYAPHRDVPHAIDEAFCNAQQIAEVVKTYDEPAVGRAITVQMWDKLSLSDFPQAEIWANERWKLRA